MYESAAYRDTIRWLFSRQFRYMLLVVLAPEIMLIDANSDFFKARYYANQTANLEVNGWRLTHLRFAEAGGFIYKIKDVDTKIDDMRYLAQLIHSRKLGRPPISVEELHSRSQSDWFIKGLAVCQILWFGIQVLLRAIQHFHNTALEILVIAFVLYSIAVYIFNWNLPQNVEYPVILEGKNDTYPTRRLEKLELRKTQLLQMAVFGILFGAVHCLAWDSPFPTPGERLAWRICAVSTTVLAPIASRAGYVTVTHDPTAHSWRHLRHIFWVFLSLYFVARMTLIILSFTALRVQPANVYQTINWTNYIPHFGA